MKLGAALTVGVLLTMACAPDYAVDRQEGLHKALISTSIPAWFDDPFYTTPAPDGPIPNSISYLLRLEDKLFGYIDVAQLTRGETITMWYASYGDPEKCTQPYRCNVGDFINPRINSAFYHSGVGGSVDDEGRFRRTGYPITNGEQEKLRVGTVLKDALTGEAWMLIRTHGPPIAGLETEQLTTWFGGCARTGDVRATFECYSPTYARHVPFDGYRTFATEGPMLNGEPNLDIDVSIEGTSCILARSDELNIVMGYVETFDMTPGDAISVSWYVFNSPASCALGIGRCTLEDADDPAVEATVVDQVGGVVADTGRFYIPLGPLNGGQIGTLRGGTGEVRPEAEMVIVLRSHGPALADRLSDQLNTYDGACDVQTCANAQYARLLPLP